MESVVILQIEENVSYNVMKMNESQIQELKNLIALIHISLQNKEIIHEIHIHNKFIIEINQKDSKCEIYYSDQYKKLHSAWNMIIKEFLSFLEDFKKKMRNSVNLSAFYEAKLFSFENIQLKYKFFKDNNKYIHLFFQSNTNIFYEILKPLFI